MHRSADAPRAVGELVGVGFGVGDEILHGFRRRGIRHHHDVRLQANERYRREVADRIVGERRIEKAVDRLTDGTEQHRVAVGFGLRDGCGADVGAAATAALDHDLLAPDLGQPGADGRPMMSVAPPGANGTMTLTKRLGQDVCARAIHALPTDASVDAADNATKRRRSSIVSSQGVRRSDGVFPKA